MILWSALAACATLTIGGPPPTFLDAPPPDAPVQITPVYEPYRVRGATEERVRRSLDRRSLFEDDGGTAWDAGTRWTVRWTWTYERGEVCRLVNPRVTGDVTVTLPEWVGRRTPPVAERFAAYHAALWHHELGHVDRVHAAGHELIDALAAVPAMPRCDDVATEATARGRAILAALRVAQEAYDRETGHGATQGASFP